MSPSRRPPGRTRAIPLASLVALLAAGCGAPITVVALTPEDLPRLQATANFPHHIYRIEPGDTLQIRYTFHSDMNQEVVVQPDGKITSPRVGEITVAGLTTTELETALKERTSDRLRNPEIVVSITRFSDKPVYVGGEVGKPGVLSYRRGLTPLQAIIAAGGFLDTAQSDSIILIRTGGREDNFVARKINLAQVVAEGAQEPLTLAPHDIVFVPRSAIANADLWVRQHITDLIPLFRGASLPVPVR